VIEILLCVLAAAAYALGSVLQRRGAISAPRSDRLRLGLIADLLRRPVWLGGIVAMIVGVVLQALALHGGAISLVEPILVAELPLTLLFAALIFRAKIDRRTGLAIVVMSGALSGLLLLARPTGGHVGHVSGLAWLLSLVATGGLIVVLVAVGLPSPPAGRAGLLGVASGLGHGLSATLLKASTVLAAQDLVVMLSSWKPYAAVVAGGVSLYLYQVALQSGPLVAGQAGLNIVDPLSGAVFGVVLFGEDVRAGSLLAAEAACAAALIGAIIVLARSPLLQGEGARPSESGTTRESSDRGRRVVS
jgi:drug/metabolite transporter (DMT)-like permease